MSEKNHPKNPIFQVNEKMYQQLLEWQQHLEHTHPENTTDHDFNPTEPDLARNTNQNDKQP
ncbi:MAG: hypothetical protein KA714_08625 [Limnoraphis sp. WC205]|jgi:hypothetical protein|uniref:Uncharacterized protein n=1 Tax=Limnoraphis robusta CCNP1315 TaxID=3110306 RepID=A0ABU5TRS5_9CYAN|nr:hypothetical protein [Limnoraphis robusta]MCG5058048.1 hypothetical protein [Limnoraphis sp. WC205]MEA5517392.1 hypothetical protein [Limnoraphis robusta CCNP1315]